MVEETFKADKIALERAFGICPFEARMMQDIDKDEILRAPFTGQIVSEMTDEDMAEWEENYRNFAD